MISFVDTYFFRFEGIQKYLGNYSGLTDTEIGEIEAHFNVVLPKAYKEYLSFFGRQSGYLFTGYYTYYPELIDNREGAESTLKRLEEIGRISSTDRADFSQQSFFFFAQWQGYNYWFFDCANGEDDPEVLLFAQMKIQPTGQRFTRFVYDEGLANVGIGML